MNEREIFLAALEIADLEDRQKYLQEACPGDQQLQQRIDKLLRSAKAAGGSFMESPASVLMSMSAIPEQTLPPQGTSAPPVDELEQGVLGDYRILREIGRGGMGVVYEAEQSSLGRIIALKVLPYASVLDKTQLARFKNEARAAASLDHPHVVSVYSVGTERGVHYFAMQLIDGQTVGDLIALERQHLGIADKSVPDPRRRSSPYEATEERRIPDGDSSAPSQALNDTAKAGSRSTATHGNGAEKRRIRTAVKLAIQAADALEHAHQMGVVHRDIKPSNLLVDAEHHLWIADFGLAMIESEGNLSTSGSMLGTLRYMSPEQIRTERHVLDHRTDVYSLGATLYEMLTLKPVFADQDVTRLMQRVTTDEPLAPRKLNSSIPLDLETIVLKAMSKDPQDRYQTAAEFSADLQRHLNDEPVQAKPPTTWERTRKWARRHRAIVRTAAATLLLAIIAAGVLLSHERSRTLAALVSEQEQHEIALDARALAEKQEQLARQQRDAAEYDAYVANIQLLVARWRRGKSFIGALRAVTPARGQPDFRGWEWYFLHSQTNWQSFSLPLQQPIMAWSRSGRLATVDMTGLVNIWSVPSGRHEKAFDIVPGISSLAWSPDEQRLAAGSDRKRVVIWDVQSGQIEQSIAIASPATTVAWNRDGIRLAIGSADGRVSVWESRTGKHLASYILNGGPVSAVQWHPQGTLLLAFGGQSGRELKLWDTTTHSQVLHRKSQYGKDASFSSDGRRLIFGAEPHRVIDLHTGQVVSTFGSRGTLNQRHSWSPDGQRVATGVLGGKVVILDAESSARRESIHGHGHIFAVEWSPSGEFLATADRTEVKVWNINQTRENPLTLMDIDDRDALDLAWSPNGDRLLVGARLGLLKVFNTESGHEELSVTSGSSWNERVAFSPDGRRFASGSRHGGAAIFDAQSGRELWTLELAGPLRGCAWHPNGRVLALASNTTHPFYGSGARVELVEAESGDYLNSTEVDGHCYEIAWSPDGKYLAVPSNFINILDSDLREQVVLPASVRATCLDWSNDSSRLAMGDKAGKITIYETTNWTAENTIDAHPGHVTDIDLHPSMPRIASSSRDRTVKVLDTQTGRELCVFDEHNTRGFPTAVAWSPDGLRLATSGREGTVLVWDGSLAANYFERDGHLNERVSDLVRTEDYQQAIDILKHLCELHPQERALRRQLGHVEWLQASKLAVTGHTAEALSHFERNSKESEDVPDYRLHLPGVLLDAEKYDAAIGMAEQFVAQFPQTREYRHELAYLYEARVFQHCRAGQFADATRILRKLATEFPDRADFRGHLVFDMAKSGRYEETVQMLEQLAQAFEKWPDYRPPLARRFGITEKYELAADVYEQLVADNPNALEYQRQLTLQRAEIKIAGDQLDEAIELLRELDLPFPEHPTFGRLGNAHLARARKNLDENKLDEAIASLSPAFEMASNDVKSRVGYELALAQLAEGRVEEYRATCLQMLEQLGDSKVVTDAHWLAWTCALAPGEELDYPAAIAAAEVALGSDSQSVSYLNTLGAILLRAEEYETAIVHLAQASDLAETASNSSPAYTWYFLAMAHHYLEQSAAAKEWLSNANTRAQEELGTDQEPKDAVWNRRLTLDLLRQEAETLLGTDADDASQEPR